MRKTFFALFMLLMLTSCFSTANRPEETKLSDREVFLGWVEQKKLPPDGFWVLLQPRGDNSDEYEILSIAKNPLFVDVEKGQEQLYVDKDYKYVQPFFTDPMSTQAIIKRDDLKEDTFDRGTWQCQYLKKYPTYSPCSSRLTRAQTIMSIAKSILSFQAYFLTAGTHRVVDTEKIKKIIIKTDLFAVIGQWKEGKWKNNTVESLQNMQEEITNANVIDPAKLRSIVNERRKQ